MYLNVLSAQLIGASNPYIFPGTNRENSLFIEYSESTTVISSKNINTITENTDYGKTEYQFNKLGNIIRNESFELLKGTDSRNRVVA